jgi:hypothetical protein
LKMHDKTWIFSENLIQGVELPRNHV